MSLISSSSPSDDVLSITISCCVVFRWNENLRPHSHGALFFSPYCILVKMSVTTYIMEVKQVYTFLGLGVGYDA